MRLIGGGKHDAKSDKQYLVCEGGYKHRDASTFRDAVALAKKMRWFSPDGAFSIYEVHTGIHFDAPKNTLFEDLTLLTMPNASFHAPKPNL